MIRHRVLSSTSRNKDKKKMGKYIIAITSSHRSQGLDVLDKKKEDRFGQGFVFGGKVGHLTTIIFSPVPKDLGLGIVPRTKQKKPQTISRRLLRSPHHTVIMTVPSAAWQARAATAFVGKSRQR
jgi:hypothetical protein